MHKSKNLLYGLSFVAVHEVEELPMAVEMVNSNQVDGIGLSFIKSWPSKDINIISKCPNIKFLWIDCAPFDYSVVNEFENLIQLGVMTNDRNEIIFSNKTKLLSAELYWRPKAKSLFECGQLEDLWIGKYNGKDLMDFKNFLNLKSLRVNTGSITKLDGIEKLSQLEKLYLAQTTKLEDISGIESLTKLKSLTIDNCKQIKNIEIINQLKNLESISIMGTTPKNGVQHGL